MANASLLTQKVQELHLSNKLEKSGQIQLDSSFSLNVSFAPDGTRCVGKLQQTLRDKEFAGGKFTLTVELVGIFSCTGATADEVKRLAAMFAKEDTSTYTGTFKFPLPANVYRITSYYGTRKDPFTGKTRSHTGVDLACAKGTEIYAADDGTVVIAKYNGSYGNCSSRKYGRR